MLQVRPSRVAMARALERAAERFEERAKAMDERVAGWRKNRHGDDTPVVAMTLHRVAAELRRWAKACLESKQ